MGDDRKSHTGFMRRKAVMLDLNITKNTLARMIETDPSFPPFFAISPGIEVITRDDYQAWLAQKKLAARLSRLTGSE